MLHTIRIASAAAFLAVAAVAAITHPDVAVARALDASDSTVTTTVTVADTASARKHVSSRIIELPTVTVVGHIHRQADVNASIMNAVAANTAALPRKVGRALPRLRLDMPYYSFGGTARGTSTRTSE